MARAGKANLLMPALQQVFRGQIAAAPVVQRDGIHGNVIVAPVHDHQGRLGLFHQPVGDLLQVRQHHDGAVDLPVALEGQHLLHIAEGAEHGIVARLANQHIQRPHHVPHIGVEQQAACIGVPDRQQQRDDAGRLSHQTARRHVGHIVVFLNDGLYFFHRRRRYPGVVLMDDI